MNPPVQTEKVTGVIYDRCLGQCLCRSLIIDYYWLLIIEYVVLVIHSDDNGKILNVLAYYVPPC